MKTVVKDKKKLIRGLIIIFGSIILVASIVTIIIKCATGTKSESGLKKELTKIGKDFYENFYYDEIGSTEKERKEFVKQFEEIGIKVSLNTLSKYKGEDKMNEVLNIFINPKTKKPCNINDTKVIIYPEKPYNKTSYNIKSEISCD